MSPYERQIDPLQSVDINYVSGVPGQASPSAEESLEILYTPPSAQRFEATLVHEVVDDALVLPPAAGLDPRIRVGIGAAALALCLVAVVTLLTADADGPSTAEIARANGGATAQVLQDLGVGLGAYTAGGLPVTLTNIANSPLAYNLTVEGLDEAGRRVTADVAFVGTLAAGQSTVVTMFGNATGGTAAELTGATFRVVEASSY